jgi:hypothetical protein
MAENASTLRAVDSLLPIWRCSACWVSGYLADAVRLGTIAPALAESPACRSPVEAPQPRGALPDSRRAVEEFRRLAP